MAPTIPSAALPFDLALQPLRLALSGRNNARPGGSGGAHLRVVISVLRVWLRLISAHQRVVHARSLRLQRPAPPEKVSDPGCHTLSGHLSGRFEIPLVEEALPLRRQEVTRSDRRDEVHELVKVAVHLAPAPLNVQRVCHDTDRPAVLDRVCPSCGACHHCPKVLDDELLELVHPRLELGARGDRRRRGRGYRINVEPGPPLVVRVPARERPPVPLAAPSALGRLAASSAATPGALAATIASVFGRHCPGQAAGLVSTCGAGESDFDMLTCAHLQLFISLQLPTM